MTMGPYLRQLAGGAIEVLMRQTEPGHRLVTTSAGAGIATGQDLIAFAAVDFREVGHQSDIWEFDVNEKTADKVGKESIRRLRFALLGQDIVMVRVERALT